MPANWTVAPLKPVTLSVFCNKSQLFMLLTVLRTKHSNHVQPK